MRISCGEQGQQFLLDNVEQITALYQKWAEPLLACLTPEWHSQGWDLPETATATELVWEKGADSLLWTLVPTQPGQTIGLYLAEEKQWLKFNRNAQQFVVDNLQKIVDYYYAHP